MENSIPPSPAETVPPTSSKLSLRPLYTVLILIFGMLLGAGGLFAYQEYMAAPPVTSFDGCMTAKGSTIQESYPATCITRDGTRFIQPVSPETYPDERVTTYTSTDAHIALTFPRRMYVTDTVTDENGSKQGAIVISTNPGGDEANAHLTIAYGLPTIEGKGGACIGENGESLWQKKTILGSSINVCETQTGLHAGYPVHPKKKTEYAFSIGGNNITPEEFALYKQILFEGLEYAPEQTFPMETFICPKTAWVDCMPGPDMTEKIECTNEFLTWAKTSCPGFEGAAL
ncbi:hypothetical protein KJZ67_02780 [Patescibacteria group bacterium]|nr:hypothetical protein [Patescibacteria group bacterium]